LHPPPCEGKDKGCLHICGMLFLSLIRYCVGECAKGTRTHTFAHPKEPHAQEAGIAVCSPPSNHVMYDVLGKGREPGLPLGMITMAHLLKEIRVG
jgi:hypothetical protein